MKIDLHCHSYFSDGELSPQELIEKAEANSISVFSITDHDNIDAYNQIEYLNYKLKLISGVEFSSTWNKIGIHIVGLNMDLSNKKLLEAISFQKTARKNRAIIISKKIEKLGVFDAYDRINKQVTNKSNKNQIGRPDFAKLLVDEGVVKDFKEAFKKYLGAGKMCDVKNQWLSLDKVIKAITSSGGIAVLAHPLSYKLTNAKLKRLIQFFKLCGGKGIEVVNGYQNLDKTRYLKGVCQDNNLLASIGSDFHCKNNWCKLGSDTKLVNDLKTVWDDF